MKLVVNKMEKNYYTELHHKNEVVVDNKNGELNVIFQNEDRSFTKSFKNWYPTESVKHNNTITLKGEMYIKELLTTVFVEINYIESNLGIVTKEISLKQANIPFLYYKIENDMTCDTINNFFSFNSAIHKGGIVHEEFPLAGYITNIGTQIGLLSDAGYKNQWTRNIRRRRVDQRGFTGIERQCDARLYQIISEEKIVKMTLGEVSDHRNGEYQEIALPVFDKIEEYMTNNLSTTVDGNKMYFRYTKKTDYFLSGVALPYMIDDGYYEVSFKHKSDRNVSITIIQEIDGIEKTKAMFYRGDQQSSKVDYVELKETFFISDTQDIVTKLLVGLVNPEEGSYLDIVDFKFKKVKPKYEAYHKMNQGEIELKKLFIYAAEGNSIRDIRYNAQVKLAEAVGFEGSDVEKILYADFYSLCWITSENDFTPHNVPNKNYAPDMYARDSFWSIISSDDKYLNESIFRRYGNTQNELGAIGTIVTPYMGSDEVKGNEATCEWLWWALINKRKFKTVLPQEKLEKAVNFVLEHFDDDRTGICKANFILGQNDITEDPINKMTNISLNQGVFAVTLRVCKELGFDVSDEYIEKANTAYRAFYDPERGYLLNDSKKPHVGSYGDLMPEVASFWLFGEGILGKEITINTLNKLPHRNYCGLFLADAQRDAFFTKETQPYDYEFTYKDGEYYNGGSWMRNEIGAYALGYIYGWDQAFERISKRLDAEINTNYEEPFSHEYIPTDFNRENPWRDSMKVFSWNVFAIRVLEMAGLRNGKQNK